MPQNGPRGHDSLYENMIPIDLQELAPECKIYTFVGRCPKTAPEVMILCTQTWFPWICKNLLLNARFTHSWPDAHERPQRLWCSVRKHDFHGFARKCSWIQELHILGQMRQNGPRGHDSLHENMISMDLQETAPECKIYLARYPRTAREAMILCTETWFPHAWTMPRTDHSAFQENHGNLSKTMPKDNQKHV